MFRHERDARAIVVKPRARRTDHLLLIKYRGVFEGLPTGQVGTDLNNALSGFAYPDGPGEGEVPVAYLNYIVYDENMVPVKADWRPVSDAAGFDANEMGLYDQHEHLVFPAPVEIEESGYIYVWVSNQSAAAKVWFDDLTVRVTQNLIVQATDYGANRRPTRLCSIRRAIKEDLVRRMRRRGGIILS